jgi:hypothetical protein
VVAGSANFAGLPSGQTIEHAHHPATPVSPISISGVHAHLRPSLRAAYSARASEKDKSDPDAGYLRKSRDWVKIPSTTGAIRPSEALFLENDAVTSFPLPGWAEGQVRPILAYASPGISKAGRYQIELGVTLRDAVALFSAFLSHLSDMSDP